MNTLRNIGISAHIDSGKTTLTERILYYTGRISDIHDVRGKDGVGAKMDHMELEREKGITIQSAATYSQWGDHNINIIDTPGILARKKIFQLTFIGHVDFTIEVERALRVLDGAILVLCSVGGVQSQTTTVDRQMKRYDVPRVSFINKMDRMGANPWKVIDQMRKKLSIGVASVQVPIGAEDAFEGVVDLINMRSIRNDGSKGERVSYGTIPEDLQQLAEQKRAELIETLADFDDEMAELFLEEIDPTAKQLKDAIRRATLSLKFTPVFMGSAFKNKSVQAVLDGVVDYLPSPGEKHNKALDLKNEESQVALLPDRNLPLVSLAFKLDDTKFGQLTYVRIYQGTLKRGMVLFNKRLNKKVRLSKLVRMHSNEMEEVKELPAGEIGAMFGVECASGDTLTDGKLDWAMSSMFVPHPVVSYSITPKKKENPQFSKALQKFMKEDPTFRVHLDNESRETIISGMGELHLDIYVERIKREYNCDCKIGQPRVAYRESITSKIPFSYTHKKQSGGSGQYGKIIGYMEPINEPDAQKPVLENEFVDKTVGMNIPSQYIPSVEKGFHEVCEKGLLAGHKVTGVRLCLEDGQSHSVDSSDIAFRLAAAGAFRESYHKADPIILEPIMKVSVTYPREFQTNVMSQINKRKGMISDNEISEGFGTLYADVPLSKMFGYVTDLRSATQGKGEFTMEYKLHQPVAKAEQEQMIKDYEKAQQTK